MIHIGKSPKTGLFQVATIAANGEELNSSEPLATKALAVKNIASSMDSYRGVHWLVVQDDSKKNPVLCVVDKENRKIKVLNEVEILHYEANVMTPYIPGKTRKQSKNK